MVHPDSPAQGDVLSYRGCLWELPLGKFWGDHPDWALLLLKESATFQSVLLPPHSPPGGRGEGWWGLVVQHITH